MEQRIYHGNLQPEDLARSLVAHFHRGNLRVQQIGSGPNLSVQIATRSAPTSGGQTALCVTLQAFGDGVAVEVGKQAWFGVAASLGMSALAALRNPFSLLSRLDDIAQDIEYLQLTEEVWRVLETSARALGASFELSDRLRRLVCAYCLTANPVGEPQCIACGAPLGESQPITCKNCGYIFVESPKSCTNCGQPF
jgi:hypothetical protein